MGQIIELPKIELRTVRRSDKAAATKPPGRKTDREHGRDRSHLTTAEVESLIEAAGKHGRYPLRDSTLVLMAYRHGLRVCELVALRWSQVDMKAARIHVVRLKNGISGTHPLTGRELRMLRKLQRESSAEHIFMSERGAPMATAAAQKVVKLAGVRAGLPFPVHIHMLRHSTGYYLINNGADVRTVQAYLGHASISNTVRYTQLDATRFRGLWHD